MRELGGAFGVSEDAAKMGVSRALERLRTLFGQRGVKCSVLVLSGLMAERAVEAAPSQVVAALAALRVPSVVGTGAALASLLGQLSKAKLAAGLATAVLVGTTALVLVHLLGRTQPLAMNGAGGTTSIPAAQPSADGTSPATSAVETAEQQQPDPLKLLQAVARARERLASGEMEFQVAIYNFSRPFNGTNQTRLKAVFDGNRSWFESFKREYAYVSLDDDTNAAAEARIQAEHLNRQAAVQAGLVEPFDSHHVTVYDGTVLMDYWDTGGPPRTSINDPAQGSGAYMFDPRILGLHPRVMLNLSVDSCLGYTGAKSVELVGEESIFGTLAWHIQVRSRSEQLLDFWLDTAHPTRVLKHARGGNVVLATYDENNPQNPLPVMVQIRDASNGTLRMEQRIACTSAKYDLPVAPETFTLAGLGMSIGTWVADGRLHRSLGYWNGSSLQANLPSTHATPPGAPNREDLLRLLDTDPGSDAALEAAQWLIANTPDGPEVEKAGQVILQEHIRSTNLLHLALELERLRPGCATNLLRAMLEQNPVAQIRGNACFSLATIRKDQANYGKNQSATAEATRSFERVLSEFGQVQHQGSSLADLAGPELADLRHLLIGQPAPVTAGKDLEGQPLRLSDYRGQAVVLSFWGRCGGCRPQMDSLLKLLARLQGKPLAILGVYCDDDPLAKAKALADELGMTWPSFQDGRSGPISKAWNNDGWPVFNVVDAQGVIRYRHLTQVELPQALEKLLGQ